ncbi:MAG: ATP-grasp fold amidoligase family protein [Anderseniella sp.]
MSSDEKKRTFSDVCRDVFWLSFVTAYCYVRHPYLTCFTWMLGKKLPTPADPDHPVDKFFWRKIFDRDPSSVALSDKLRAKQIAIELCPDIKVPETLWTGQRFEDIPPELLAGDAVVKSTHGSGFFHIIRGGKYDRQEMIARTRKWLRTDYSRYCGEWNYLGVERKLFVEEFLKHADGRPVSLEAKVYVFGDTALYSFCFHDRLTDQARQSFYDAHGNVYPYTQYLHYPVSFDPAPASHSRMLEIAERLAAGRDHVRVDLYEIDGDIYFSEFTFHTIGGKLGSAVQREFPQISSIWDLRRTWFLTQPQPGWRGAYARWLKARLNFVAEPEE